MRNEATYSGKRSHVETDSVMAYMKDIKNSSKLTTKDENALALRIHTGDKKALQTLIQANLKFVVAVCRNYMNQGLPLADLINEGNLGLIRAALRFEGAKEIRFISYAVWWIRQGILEALARQSRTISIPSSYSMGIHKINNASRNLSQSLGRQPSVEEVELETGMHADRIRLCLRLGEPALSLNFTIDGEDGSEFQDSLADHSSPNAEEKMNLEQTHDLLEKMLSRLNRREREVLKLYFGMESGVSNSLGDIANRFGLSRERVRQIKKRGLANVGRFLTISKERVNLV